MLLDKLSSLFRKEGKRDLRLSYDIIMKAYQAFTNKESDESLLKSIVLEHREKAINYIDGNFKQSEEERKLNEQLKNFISEILPNKEMEYSDFELFNLTKSSDRGGWDGGS